MKRHLRRALRAAAVNAALRLAGNAFGNLRAVASADASPKWNQIFPMGTFHNGGWPADGVTVDRAFCEAIVANWKKHGGALAVDYFHKTNEEDAPNDERIASGWMQDLEAREDGVYALIDWTAKARAKILAGELANISPEFHLNGTDARTGKPQGPTLVCAALLNNQAFKEMPRVAASAVVDPPAPPNPAVEEFIMNKKQMLALLAKFQNTTVTDASTDAEVLAAFEKQMDVNVKASSDAAAALKATITAADALKASEEASKALQAQLTEANTEKAKLGVRVANIEKQALDTAVNTLCKRALDERRIAAAGQESVKALAAASGLEAATKFVDSFAKGTIAAAATETGHGAAGDADETEEAEVKAAAAEAVKASGGKLTGSAAIRAAALANPGVVKRLAAVPTAHAPKS